MSIDNVNDIVTINNQGLADITDDIIASAERRISQIEKIKTLALKCTNENDWVDQQGKPYLQGSGAEKVARLFGISWKIVRSEKINTNDEKGTFYFYQVTGVFTLAGGKDSVESVGTCSSKDKFFSKSGGELKPLSEIDETNIMKSAYTNCVVNGITRLLGLRNLTWDQVRAGGIDSNKTAKVKYANGGAGGGIISEPQRKRLFAISKTANKTDEEIKKHLRENYGIESTTEIKIEWYTDICEWAEGKIK